MTSRDPLVILYPSITKEGTEAETYVSVRGQHPGQVRIVRGGAEASFGGAQGTARPASRHPVHGTLPLQGLVTLDNLHGISYIVFVTKQRRFPMMFLVILICLLIGFYAGIQHERLTWNHLIRWGRIPTPGLDWEYTGQWQDARRTVLDADAALEDTERGELRR